MNSVETEAKAYAEGLASNGFVLDVDESDTANGEYLYKSASGNFEVEVYVGESSFELVVSAYVKHETSYDAAGLAAVNTVINERNGFAFPDTLLAAFTGSYSGIEFFSYYNTRYSLGHSIVDFVSTVAEGGDAAAVNADADVVRAYLEANGFERKVSQSSGVEYFLDANNNEIHVDVIAPDATDEDAPATYVLEVTIFAKPASGGGEETYTLDKVVEDVNALLAAQGLSGLTDKTTYYSKAVAFGNGTAADENETTLKGLCASFASYFLPTYMVKAAEAYCNPAEGGQDIFGDGTITYVMVYMTPDGSVRAQITSYIYSGKKVAQVAISAVA